MRLSEGDRVAYSRGFLRSTGQYTGPEAPCSYGPFARGTVSIVHDDRERRPAWECVAVHWDDGRDSNVNVNNLVKVSKLQFEER